MSVAALAVFLSHLITALIIALFFVGAGKVLKRLLGLCSDMPQNCSELLEESLLGYCGVYLVAILLYTYLPSPWVGKLSIVALVVFPPVAVGSELWRWKRDNWSFRVFWGWGFLCFSLALVYLPFVSSQKTFLASEGGGDITGYLGFAKVFLHKASEPLVEAPRFLITMRGWLEKWGFVTVPRPLVYREVDPIFIGFYNDFAATNYSPLLLFFPLRVLVPAETIYMSLFMLVLALIPLTLASAIPSKLRASTLWAILAFMIAATSAGLQSVYLNHYVYQLQSILWLTAIFACAVKLLAREGARVIQYAMIIMSLMAIVISYFPAIAPAFVFSGVAGLLFCVRERTFRERPVSWLWSRLSFSWMGWMVLCVVLFMPLAMEPISRIDYLHILKPVGNPADRELSYAVWGRPLRAFRDTIMGLQGSLIHNLAAPYTDLNVQDLWSYRLAPLLAMLTCVLVLALGVLLWKRWRRAANFWQAFGSVGVFALATLLLIPAMCRGVSEHSYTFDKMAMMTLPAMIGSVILIMALLIHDLEAKSLKVGLFGASLVLLLWFFGNAQARLYQIRSFWHDANRDFTLYTQGYLESLPFPVNPSRSFMLTNPGSGTDYFLSEASLAGLNTFPMNNYYHPRFSYTLAKVDFAHSNFVIAQGREAKAYALDRFYLDRSGDYALPIDPFVDPVASALPAKIVIGRTNDYGTGIVLKSSRPRRLICVPFGKVETCSMEVAPLGSETFAQLKGIWKDQSGSCLFNVAAKAEVQALHFRNCRQISFE